MSAIITGITNMKDDRICISCYEETNKRYIRPLLKHNHLRVNFLSEYNVSLGTKISLSYTEVHTPPPHIEDVWIDLNSVTVLDQFTKTQFKDFITSISDNCVEDIFGYEIELISGQPVVPDGFGRKSLGAIVCRNCSVYQDQYGKLRCDLIDVKGREYRHIPVVARDEWVCPQGTFSHIPIRLSLSRLWQKKGMEESFYWLQVSGVIR